MPRARLLLLIVLWEGFLYQIMPTEYMHSIDSEKMQRELCAIIPCKFDFPTTVALGNNPPTYWYREATDKLITTNDCSQVSKNNKDCLQLLGSLEKHDCTLKINDANEEDVGRYFFRTEGKFLYSFFRIKPFANRIDLSQQATISLPAMLAARVAVNIACTALGRCTGTAPIITWTGILNIPNTTAYISSVNISSITFTPSLRDDNQTLICVVYYPAAEASIKTTVSLNVGYRLDSGDQMESNCSEIHEGMNCSCFIHSNPPPILKWLINEEIVSGNYSNHTLKVLTGINGYSAKGTLTIHRKRAHDLKIQCWNANKQSSLLADFFVSFDSRIITGIICGIIILAALVSLAAFYGGRKVQEIEREMTELKTFEEEEEEEEEEEVEGEGTISSSITASSISSESTEDEPTTEGVG